MFSFSWMQSKFTSILSDVNCLSNLQEIREQRNPACAYIFNMSIVWCMIRSVIDILMSSQFNALICMLRNIFLSPMLHLFLFACSNYGGEQFSNMCPLDWIQIGFNTLYASTNVSDSSLNGHWVVECVAIMLTFAFLMSILSCQRYKHTSHITSWVKWVLGITRYN